MNIDINAMDLLTEDQKDEIGNAITQKIMKGIAELQFAKGKKVDITTRTNQIIAELFEDDNLYEHIDYRQIGAKLTKKLTDGI